MSAMKEVAMKVETSIFTGIVRNRSESVCRCHEKRVVCARGTQGEPACGITGHDLAYSDVITRKLPDMVFPGFIGERPEGAVDWKANDE